MSVEDKNSAVETVSREKATSDPGSVGAPMSGVVVEVRVKDGQEIKKGDPICGESGGLYDAYSGLTVSFTTTSDERDEGVCLWMPCDDICLISPSADGVVCYCARVRPYQASRRT